MSRPPANKIHVPNGYRDQARGILAKLPGATRRDRMAFAYGYVVAFEAMSSALPPHTFIHYRYLALALTDLAAQERR